MNKQQGYIKPSKYKKEKDPFIFIHIPICI